MRGQTTTTAGRVRRFDLVDRRKRGTWFTSLLPPSGPLLFYLISSCDRRQGNLLTSLSPPLFFKIFVILRCSPKAGDLTSARWSADCSPSQKWNVIVQPIVCSVHSALHLPPFCFPPPRQPRRETGVARPGKPNGFGGAPRDRRFVVLNWMVSRLTSSFSPLPFPPSLTPARHTICSVPWHDLSAGAMK
mgnify:FL=1